MASPTKAVHILVAADKFKGSLSALEAVEAIAAGLEAANINATITQVPLADGGEGSLATVMGSAGMLSHSMQVRGPLGSPVIAQYGTKGDTACIEMALASGLGLLRPHEYNVMQTSSYGTGQLMASALQKGAHHIDLYVGGSASNDGGIGIAAALGYRFYDAANRLLPACGASLPALVHITAPAKQVPNFSLNLITDVQNPLYGPQGAAQVYAPQKGASPEEAMILDHGLENLAGVIKAQFGIEVSGIAGAGAAGAGPAGAPP